MAKFDAKQLLREKKFWIATFLITWAAALQGHMMWLKRQDSFKNKFGTINEGNESTDNVEQKNDPDQDSS